MALESCPLRPTETKFPIEVRPSMQTALTEEEDKFLLIFVRITLFQNKKV